MPFSDLGLSEKVLNAVEAAGYTEPTPIQAEAIPHVLARRDVLGIAQTGTGKTAAFTLPMLTLLENGRARARMPRTLILEPTRELAAQVVENFDRYGTNHKLNVALIIGGVSFADQDAKLMRGTDVLIATPGRLLDHFERGKLLLTGVELLVIDEADRMLDMGFIPDIERIVKMVPFTRQTLFFSATMPPEIERLADMFLHNPQRVEVARPASTATTITQRLVATGAEGHAKRERLRTLIRGEGELKNGIIFCNRKRDVALLQKSLVSHGFDAAALHGDMDQRARTTALDGFRNGDTALLVASDVAARGLDIPAVSHVFNFDVPHHPEDYVHRIGRTGRAGRSGTAYTLVAPDDSRSLGAIEALIGQPIPWLDGDLTSVADPSGDTGTRHRGRASDGRRGGRSAKSGGRSGDKSGSDKGADKGADKAVVEKSARSTSETEEVRERSTRSRGSRGAARAESRPDDRPESRSESRPENRPEPRASGRASGRGGESAREERGRRIDADGDTPVGLGSHVPAFLLRPVLAKKDK
ncbi:Superfamily II DNA and RNA helicase [Methylobacterium sp. UNC300MFChir4.1]|uniref:DEAD/DEAH box helicase n=1 Tax=Methylobacterium sp. UNC300MFChir4.1 TaxID=1502747 RepID=UPI0008B44AE9|nr:DEAD/DEAH box helicase [Methylobacterium sp. UNC300MFChir4.1]SEP20544.1 Superfamily II DNA and RNA helicase [Methylobacterium sp. UNC300MFChir4.1]